MSRPQLHRAAECGGLLEKLMAVVRPEFRVEVYFPDPDDPVLGCRRWRCFLPTPAPS